MTVQAASLGARALARCDLLAKPPFSEEAGRLTRRFLTDAHAAAIAALRGWMEAAGLSVRLDPAGNLIGRYEGQEPGAPALLIGSHIDTVRDGGRYDGTLGVMLGLGCLETLAAERRRLPFAIELVAFGDEEGSRFPASMIGSRALAACLDGDPMSLADDAGTTLAEALAAFGLDPQALGKAARRPGDILAYFEAHIEQGPLLEVEGLPLGIVTGIAAQLRLALRWHGWAGHAGTTPMRLRRDALAAAAEATLAVETICTAGHNGLVGTVGMIEVRPGAANVIPGSAIMSVDLRAADEATRNQAAREIERAGREIAARRGVSFDLEVVQDLSACPCAPFLTELLADAVTDLGLAPIRLASGAGHDAMSLARLAPVAMLFIRCAGGVSHHPAERVAAADADVAARAMLRFIERLAQRSGTPASHDSKRR